MCEDGSAGDDAPYAVCPSIDDNPEMPGTMDQKDSHEGAEGAGTLCVRLKGTGVSTGGRAHSSHDIGVHQLSTLTTEVVCARLEYASDDAPHVNFPSIVGGYNMPGIMFGMDQKDSNSSDEVLIKRCNVTAVADDASCLFRHLEIDPSTDE